MRSEARSRSEIVPTATWALTFDSDLACPYGVPLEVAPKRDGAAAVRPSRMYGTQRSPHLNDPAVKMSRSQSRGGLLLAIRLGLFR